MLVSRKAEIDMSKHSGESLFPLLILIFSLIGCLAHLVQNIVGYESETALPTGSALTPLLFGVLLISSVVLALFALRFPKDDKRLSFAAAFASGRTDALLPLIGAFVIILSALPELAAGLGFTPSGIPVVVTITERMGLISAIATAFGGCGLVVAVVACCGTGKREASPFTSTVLLIPAIAELVRLVLIYREMCVYPTLSRYAIELLALCFAAMAFYRLASFAYRDSSTRAFLLYASISVVLCFATLTGSGRIFHRLHNLGCALALYGLIRLRLMNPGAKAPAEEKAASDHAAKAPKAAREA